MEMVNLEKEHLIQSVITAVAAAFLIPRVDYLWLNQFICFPFYVLMTAEGEFCPGFQKAELWLISSKQWNGNKMSLNGNKSWCYEQTFPCGCWSCSASCRLVVVPLFQGFGTEYLNILEVKLNTFSLWEVENVLEMGNYLKKGWFSDF